jgi:hypothetical protein
VRIGYLIESDAAIIRPRIVDWIEQEEQDPPKSSLIAMTLPLKRIDFEAFAGGPTHLQQNIWGECKVK